MRLHILSDLHLEFGPFAAPKVEADVVVLAGDTQPGKRGGEWARRTFPNQPVLYVLGNHDYYAKVMPRLIPELRALADGTNVHILENDSVEINSTVFWGATLWTDFELNRNPLKSIIEAEEGISDYRKIFRDESETPIRGADIRMLHEDSVRALRAHVASGKSARGVILTHHAPSSRSLPVGMEGGEHSPSYASSLDGLIEESRASLWIHGHIHCVADYRIGETRVLCNPRGYSFQDVPGFNASFVVEV